jgi:hypothetical protein
MSPSVKGLWEQSNNPQQLSAVSSQSVSSAIGKKKKEWCISIQAA